MQLCSEIGKIKRHSNVLFPLHLPGQRQERLVPRRRRRRCALLRARGQRKQRPHGLPKHRLHHGRRGRVAEQLAQLLQAGLVTAHDERGQKGAAEAPRKLGLCGSTPGWRGEENFIAVTASRSLHGNSTCNYVCSNHCDGWLKF
jgi:hypothetical protein